MYEIVSIKRLTIPGRMSVVVLSGKELHRQVHMDRVVASGKPSWCNALHTLPEWKWWGFDYRFRRFYFPFSSDSKFYPPREAEAGPWQWHGKEAKRHTASPVICNDGVMSHKSKRTCWHPYTTRSVWRWLRAVILFEAITGISREVQLFLFYPKSI